ncbi:MAG: hypothetical protein ACPGRC_00890 [Salibacteraceae bacterium]
MKLTHIILASSIGIFTLGQATANQPLKPEINNFSPAPSGVSKIQKQEALLTSKKWICMEVSKKRLTKKLDFDIGNEFGLSIDKKYNFKNNNYDYSNGTWKIDGKFLYFFYNAPGTENKTETSKYKILKLNETTLVLKRLDRPKGKITFK